MRAAYTTTPFSVPHCPAGTSRTIGALILYGAVWTAVTEPPGLIAEVRLHQVLAILVNSLLPRPPTGPAWLSAASTSARCEPVPAFLLIPDLSIHPARPSAASAASRCEPVPAFPLLPGLSTCPAWPSAASAASRCKPFSPNRLTPASRAQASGPTLWQQAPGNRQPPAMLLC